MVAIVSGSASIVSFFSGSNLLAQVYGDYMGSRYDRKLVHYPILDLRLLKRGLQKVSVFNDGCYQVKSAENWDPMMSRSGLRHAILTGELSIPSAVEVVSKMWVCGL